MIKRPPKQRDPLDIAGIVAKTNFIMIVAIEDRNWMRSADPSDNWAVTLSEGGHFSYAHDVQAAVYKAMKAWSKPAPKPPSSQSVSP